MNLNNDKNLATLLKQGDKKAYDFLMYSYYQKLCSYAFTLTNDSFKSEDIVQNVMVKLWEHRKNIQFNKSIKSYLYRSVYNEFIDSFRKDAKIIFIEKKYIEALDVIVEDDNLDIEQLISEVNEEINKLPKKCKQVFLLNKKEGLTHKEIAIHLNISIKTIEGHMTRAFKILNKKLGEKIEPLLFLLFGFRANKVNYIV